MCEANGPVVDAFCFAFAQDGAHELFANVFAFEAGTQARTQAVVAFAVLGGNAARCCGDRLCGGSARGRRGRLRRTWFRCGGLRDRSYRCSLAEHGQLFSRYLFGTRYRLRGFRGGGFGRLLAGAQTLQVLFDARRSVGERGLAEHTGGGGTGSRCGRLRHCRRRSCGFGRSWLRYCGLGCRCYRRCGSNRCRARHRCGLFCGCFFRHAGSRSRSLCRAGGKERGGRRRLRGCRLGRNRSANFSILNYCRFCGVRFNLNISRRVCGNFGCLLLIAELIVATTQSGNEFLPGGIGNDFLGRVDISGEVLVENLRRGFKELLRGGVGGGCAGAE